MCNFALRSLLYLLYDTRCQYTMKGKMPRLKGVDFFTTLFQSQATKALVQSDHSFMGESCNPTRPTFSVSPLFMFTILPMKGNTRPRMTHISNGKLPHIG